jgi:biopolymer transport protein ExbD
MRTLKRSSQLYCRIDVAAGLIALFLVLFIFMVFATAQPFHTYRNIIDMPRSSGAISLPAAIKEDALQVNITRDGAAYLGDKRISLEQLSGTIRDGLAAGSERVVYIAADSRARYADVESVLLEIQRAGVERIAFLTQ